MELQVTNISFLTSGKIAVDVSGKNSSNPPKPPALDSLKMSVYMEYAPSDSIQKIKDAALDIARASMK